MQLTNEQFKALQNCRTTEEIITKGKEMGMTVAAEEAQEILNGTSFQEISTEDIENVAGGCFTTTRSCRMCKTDISHSPFYRHYNTGREYCVTCAGNSGMINNRDYYYVAND